MKVRLMYVKLARYRTSGNGFHFFKIRLLTLSLTGSTNRPTTDNINCRNLKEIEDGRRKERR
jgi:hypothetical protein